VEENMKRLKLLVAVFVMFTGMAGVIFAAGKSQVENSSSSLETRLLTIGIQANSFITDYKNNYLTQYLERLHKVTLDFYMLPTEATEVRTKFSLMVSSNDLPDTLMPNGALTAEQILDYGSKGAFVSLNKYLNDSVKAPNFAKIPADDKANIIRTSTSADGNIYALPRYEPENWNMTPYRYYINKAWLDKLGLQIPNTTSELRNVLIAFRDGDPNGNGRKDEIGLYGWFGGGYGENTISAIINSFLFYNMDSLSLDAAGKKVIAPFTEPAFRKALVYLNDLYREGLLAASLFTDNQQQFRATLNSTPPIAGITTAGSYGNWPNANFNQNFIDLAMIPPLTGPDGVCYTPYQEYVPTQAGMITSRCRDPDFAFTFLESFFDPEISLIVRYGEEGVDWSRKPEDLVKTDSAYVQLGIASGLTLVQLTNIWAEPSNKFWHNVQSRYASLEKANTIGSLLLPYDGTLPTSKLQVFNYQHYLDKHPAQVLPLLRYTAQEAERLAEPITNINEYVKQSIAEFVTGARDINSNAAWDAYIRELNAMGLQQWLSTAQTSYDRL
jgi:putative aldouronate transport system substrate-binding protein